MILPIDDDQPKTWFSPVTHGLIAVNTLVLLLVLATDDPQATMLAWALHPHRPTPLTFLSSIFLHAGIGHLVGNMLFLHIAGRPLEFKLGPARFLALYFGSGLLADIVQSVASPLPSLGASGAIAGLFSAYVVLLPWGSVKLFYYFGLLWYGTWEVNAIWLLVYFVGEQAVCLALLGSHSGVGFAAHLGGVAGGFVAAAILKKYLPATDPRLERAPVVGARRAGPFRVKPVSSRSKTAVLAGERGTARVEIQAALARDDADRVLHLYDQAELLGVRPVLPASAQERLARLLLDANELVLAKTALLDLVRVHAGSAEALRAQRLLARFRAPATKPALSGSGAGFPAFPA